MTPGTISICEKIQFQEWFSYTYYADAHLSKSLPKITVVQHYQVKIKYIRTSYVATLIGCIGSGSRYTQ